MMYWPVLTSQPTLVWARHVRFGFRNRIFFCSSRSVSPSLLSSLFSVHNVFVTRRLSCLYFIFTHICIFGFSFFLSSSSLLVTHAHTFAHSHSQARTSNNNVVVLSIYRVSWYWFAVAIHLAFVLLCTKIAFEALFLLLLFSFLFHFISFIPFAVRMGDFRVRTHKIELHVCLIYVRRLRTVYDFRFASSFFCSLPLWFAWPMGL